MEFKLQLLIGFIIGVPATVLAFLLQAASVPAAPRIDWTPIIIAFIVGLPGTIAAIAALFKIVETQKAVVATTAAVAKTEVTLAETQRAVAATTAAVVDTKVTLAETAQKIERTEKKVDEVHLATNGMHQKIVDLTEKAGILKEAAADAAGQARGVLEEKARQADAPKPASQVPPTLQVVEGTPFTAEGHLEMPDKPKEKP